jgi:hypothetical protein
MSNGDCLYLGSIKPGAGFEDGVSALREVTAVLLSADVIPIIIGGSVDLLFGMYQGMQGVSENLDMTYVSATLPFARNEVLGKICAHQPNYLFNMNLLGFQGHYVSPQSIETIHNMGFDFIRLGALKSSIEDAEPLLRNTNLFSFDLGAIKQSDAPANFYSNPIGLDGDMACQLAWYAGVSDTSNAFGLFEMNPEFDYRNQSSKLSAQIIWYFLDGVNSRKNDHPHYHSDFLKYRCNLDKRYPDIVFHKSKRTNRWWMEIPNPKSLNNKDKNVIVPCSYADYQASAKGEIPERYLKSLQKMH